MTHHKCLETCKTLNSKDIFAIYKHQCLFGVHIKIRYQLYPVYFLLTQWGRVTHKCVGILTTIGSDNGLSPGRHQAIIWTNAGILLIGPLGTNFSEILKEIQTLSFKKMHLKMSPAKWCSFCLNLNVLNNLSSHPSFLCKNAALK